MNECLHRVSAGYGCLRVRQTVGRQSNPKQMYPKNHQVKSASYNCQASKNAAHNSHGVRVLHELQHGTARWKQVGIRRASNLGSRALEQHVHFIPQCAMVTMQAKPLKSRSAVIALRHGEGLVAPQPEPDKRVNLCKPQGQAKKGTCRFQCQTICKQGKSCRGSCRV